MKILVAYGTAHGSTGEVAEFMARLLRAYDVEADARNIQDIQSVEDYDAVLLGSPIHGGTWLHEVATFARHHGAELVKKPCFAWITCIRALEPDGHQHALKHYFDHDTLKKLNIRHTGVFTGKLRTDAITRAEQWYLAARYDGKATPGVIKDDFRNWQAIAGWTHHVAASLRLTPVFEVAETEPVL